MTGRREIGWREMLLGVPLPLLLAAVWVWRYGDVPPARQEVVALLSAAAVVLGALLGGRRVLRAVVARRAGQPPAPDRLSYAAGLGLTITGVVLVRMLVPDTLLLVAVAGVAGMLGAALPAYALASRRGGATPRR